MGFDLNEWYNRVGPIQPNQYGQWQTRDILGPRDACCISRVRELVRPHFQFGPPTPVDLFLLSVGEPPSRNCTKIGGLPFWPRDREWPQSVTGEVLPFLAQFSFQESADIVGETPGDILLLFGDKDYPSTVVARWVSSSEVVPLVEHDDVPIESPSPAFSGIRWRTEHYPEADYAQCDTTLPNGTSVLNLWFLSEMVGMQISPYPFFPRWDGRPAKNERAICSLCSVFPKTDILWPFVNRSGPLMEHEVKSLTFDLTDQKDADGFGVVCVALDDSGETTVFCENL